MPVARVAINVPSGETWKAKTAVCHSELCVFSTLNDIGTKTLNYQCSVISMSRNRLVRLALALDPQPTHILWIDSDMAFEADALVRLLQHDKDVVGAFYNRRTPPYMTAGHLVEPADVSKGGLHKADVMPHGLVLVKKHVYDVVPSPWYSECYDPAVVSEEDPDGTVGEDVTFSRKVIAAGFDMWCDADLTFQTGHIGEITVPCLRPEPLQTRFTSKEAAR